MFGDDDRVIVPPQTPARHVENGNLIDVGRHTYVRTDLGDQFGGIRARSRTKSLDLDPAAKTGTGDR